MTNLIVIILRASSTLQNESRSLTIRILIVFSFIFLFSFSINKAHALKILPQSKVSNKIAMPKRSSSVGISVTPKLRADRKALNVYFANLQNAESVSYMLIYQTNGQQEGAGGSVRPSDGDTSRELLFGTCSKNVCRYHANISNMKLEVTAQLKGGKKLLKRYKIRV